MIADCAAVRRRHFRPVHPEPDTGVRLAAADISCSWRSALHKTGMLIFAHAISNLVAPLQQGDHSSRQADADPVGIRDPQSELPP
jgi:hypothetical protein